MLKIQPKALKAAIYAPSRTVARKSTKRIFECAMLEWGPDGATVSATDLEFAAVAQLPVLDVSGSGRAVVPMAALTSLGKVKTDAVTLTLRTGEAGPVLRAEWTTARASCDREIECEDPDQYPEIPTADVRHDAPGLGIALEQGARFAGQEAARFVLNAMQLGPDGLVATDGRRLYHAPMALTGSACLIGVPPVKAAPLRSIDGYALGEKHVHLYGDGFRLTVRTRDGTFPPHDQIIPRMERCQRIPVDSAAWIEAVASLKDCFSTETNTVAVETSGRTLSFRAANGDGRGCVTMGLDEDAPPLRVGFNPDYLMDILKLEPDALYARDGNSACLFNGTGKPRMVLMPVLID